MGEARCNALCAQPGTLAGCQRAEGLGRNSTDGNATVEVPVGRGGDAQTRSRVDRRPVDSLERAPQIRTRRARIALSVGATATAAHLWMELEE